MGKYQTVAQRDYRYKLIAQAEGEMCLICWGETGKIVKPPRKKLVIEHADNDPRNWRSNNLHLACYSCNKKMEKWPVLQKINTINLYSDQLEREREKKNLPTKTSVYKSLCISGNSSSEIMLNRNYYPKWLQYVYERINEDVVVEKKDLVLSAAKRAGCSKQTSGNYLDVETSTEGNLQEIVDIDGNKIITYKDD